MKNDIWIITGKLKAFKNNGVTVKIKDIPENIILEESIVVTLLIHLFNENKNTFYSIEEITSNLFLLWEFENFILRLAFTWKLPFIINESHWDKIEKLLKEFKTTHSFRVKSVDNYYVKIKKRLFEKKEIEKNKEDINSQMRKFNLAYHLVKSAFEKKNRETKDESGKNERYFNHLTWVMDVILNELPDPNIDTVIIWLLHDSIEDIKWFNFELIKTLFWEYIAKWVETLSKKKLDKYMGFINKKVVKILWEKSSTGKKIISKAKEDRIEDYFWKHMRELPDAYLTVKFADRIHNLRTLRWTSPEKIIRKIKETENYFFTIAQFKNSTAYTLMKTEIDILKREFNLD